MYLNTVGVRVGFRFFNPVLHIGILVKHELLHVSILTIHNLGSFSEPPAFDGNLIRI